MAKEIASKMDHIAAQLLAHAELQADKAKAVGKYSAKVIKAKGQQAQAQYDAEAEAEAAGSETPVGPPASGVPFPPARNPSQSVAGSTMPSVEDLFGGDPSSVAGGGGIQAATGGMGRAAPDETAPPFIVSQTQSQGAQLVTPGLGGFSDRVPMTETRTNVTPNVLSAGDVLQARIAREKLALDVTSARELSQYRQARLDNDIARTESTLASDASKIRSNNILSRYRLGKIEDQDRKRLETEVSKYGNSLADLYALGTENRLTHDEVKVREQAILEAIDNPLMKAAVKEHAIRTLNTVQAARSLKGTGMAIRTADGTTIVQGDAAEILNNESELAANTNRVKAARRWQAGESGRKQTEEFIKFAEANPEILGARGLLTGAVTKTLGALGDFVPSVRDSAIRELTADYRRSIADPNIPPAEKAELSVSYSQSLKELNRAFGGSYNPESVGRANVLLNAIRITRAKAAMGGELNIRGFELLGKEFIDPTRAVSRTQALSELRTLAEDFAREAREGEADYARMGGDASLTVEQLLGDADIEKFGTGKAATPEFTTWDILGQPRPTTIAPIPNRPTPQATPLAPTTTPTPKPGTKDNPIPWER